MRVPFVEDVPSPGLSRRAHTGHHLSGAESPGRQMVGIVQVKQRNVVGNVEHSKDPAASWEVRRFEHCVRPCAQVAESLTDRTLRRGRKIPGLIHVRIIEAEVSLCRDMEVGPVSRLTALRGGVVCIDSIGEHALCHRHFESPHHIGRTTKAQYIDRTGPVKVRIRSLEPVNRRFRRPDQECLGDDIIQVH